MTTTGAPSGVGQLSALPGSWRMHSEAANLSPRTVRGYTNDCALFAAFLADKGMPTAVARIKREHVEAFITAELERTSVSSAATRYRPGRDLRNRRDDGTTLRTLACQTAWQRGPRRR